MPVIQQFSIALFRHSGFKGENNISVIMHRQQCLYYVLRKGMTGKCFVEFSGMSVSNCEVPILFSIIIMRRKRRFMKQLHTVTHILGVLNLMQIDVIGASQLKKTSSC